MNKLNQTRIDNYFRQVLNSPPDASPSDSEWKEMELLLKSEPTRRPVIAWVYWTAGIAAALLIFLSLWFFTENTDSENQLAKIKVPAKSEENKSRAITKTENKPNIITPERSDHTEPELVSQDKIAYKSNKQSGPLNPFAPVENNSSIPGSLELKLLNSRDTFTPLNSAQVLAVKGSIVPGTAIGITGRDPALSMGGLSFSTKKDAPYAPERPSSQNSVGKWAVSLAFSPDLNSVKGIGKSSFGISGGMGLSYKIWKSVAASTGLFYSQKAYSSDKTSYHAKEKPFATWTSYSQKIDADCRVLDIPLNLNITLKDKPRRKILASAGLSSYIMLSEKYNFIYDPSPGYPSKGREYTIRNDNQHILSVVNLSLGIEKPLTGQSSIVIQPYAKLPLTGIGQGKTDLKSFGLGFQLNYSLKKKQILMESKR